MYGDPHVGGANDYADGLGGFISPFGYRYPIVMQEICLYAL